MRSWMKQRGLWAAGILLVAALAAIGWCLWEVGQIDGHFQCLWLPPAQQQKAGSSSGDAGNTPGAPGNLDAGGAGSAGGSISNAGLRAQREKAKLMTEQLEGACDRTTLFAIASPAAISVEDSTASAAARLEAISEDAYALKPITLYGGRLIYPEEFERGERVAMVDEQLAVALFQYAEPLEREILIAGESYRIVGIVRSHKQVGDQQDYSLYVPFLAIEKSSLPLTALCYEASPVPGAGGWSAFGVAAASQVEGGTTLSLSKEKTNATMPVRVLGVVAGFVLLFAVVRFVSRKVKAFYALYRQRLMDEYAPHLLPWLLGRGFLFVLAYAACAFAFAQLFVLLVDPVYTFPEWVPAILVEPNDIAAAFWNVWQSMAAVVELRSPELLRIRFWARLLGWTSGIAAGALGVCWGRVKRGGE